MLTITKFKAIIDINNCELSDGRLPSKQMKLVLAWAEFIKKNFWQIGNWLRMESFRFPYNHYNKEIVMYPSVVSVKALDDYKLLLVFETSEKRIFDVAPYLNTSKFAELRNPLVFHTVTVKFDTIEWSNQLDIDPEFLYEKSIKAEA